MEVNKISLPLQTDQQVKKNPVEINNYPKESIIQYTDDERSYTYDIIKKVNYPSATYLNYTKSQKAFEFLIIMNDAEIVHNLQQSIGKDGRRNVVDILKYLMPGLIGRKILHILITTFPTFISKMISDFKFLIWNKKKNTLGINDPDIMMHWKAEKEENEVKNLEANNIKDILSGETLRPNRKLNSYFLKGIKAEDAEYIYIVQVPAASGIRKVEDSNLDEINIVKKEELIGTLEFLMKQEGVKHNFNKPHKFCANRYIFERKGRKEPLCNDSNFIQAVENKLNLNDKFCFEWFLQKNPGNKNAERIINELRNSASICIAFNGSSPSPYNFNIDGDYKEIGLVMHIIWSYFFDDTRLSWDSFYEKFKRTFDY
ncbi:hypothetical protein RhiirA4_474457 [Rhizophagus irregularis]|uniref:Uncharacterized protein n=1 Tax=Rhizophagus irregularis TaxID=588596 RepID=A0A2I1H8H4_9GLOM|nr:hypothetical protein RhiirA4_474457 [Rhizophagus irregularis]